ncbi:MAG TPA: glucose 1-dehydrogenase [Acidimicrobiales bacterium]
MTGPAGQVPPEPGRAREAGGRQTPDAGPTPGEQGADRPEHTPEPEHTPQPEHTPRGELAGRVAIVTGSSSGMGEAIARRFAAEGARVVVNSSRSAEAGERVAADLPDAVYVRADVGVRAEAERLAEAALDRWGRIDVVVNNAAIAPMVPHHDLDGLTDDIWQRTLAVNLLGPWHLTRAAAPALRADGGGAVVNVTSLGGIRTTETWTAMAYHVSKAALNRLTELLANVLGPEVRVNALAPGGIETPMWGDGADYLRRDLRSRTLLRRAGHVDEIAEACLFLARPGYVTGQVLTVDGGMGVMVHRPRSRDGAGDRTDDGAGADAPAGAPSDRAAATATGAREPR